MHRRRTGSPGPGGRCSAQSSTNFEGNADFYYQDPLNIGTEIFHHIIIYGGPQDPVTGLALTDYWYRGERRYIRSVVDAGWMRDHIL